MLIAMVLSAGELDNLRAGETRTALVSEHFSYGAVLFLIMLVRLRLRYRSLNPVEPYRIHPLQRIRQAHVK